MKKFALLSLPLIGTAALVPSFAQAATSDDIQVDQAAIKKDNAALKRDQATLRRHRAAKAAAKANGDTGQQAVESGKIGVDQSAIGEKQTEKNVDQKSSSTTKIIKTTPTQTRRRA